MEIMKNDIPEIISVRSIRTVYSLDLGGHEPVGDVHDFPEIIYICRGKDNILIDGERVSLSEGQMTVYPPGAYHIGEEQCDVSVYIISFDSDSEALKALYSRAITLSRGQIESLSEIVQSGLALLERIPRGGEFRGMRKRESASDLQLQTMKNRLELFLLDVYHRQLNAMGEVGDSKRLLFERICDHLAENIGKRLTLDSVARKFHLGKSTLTALFRSECGMGMIARFNVMKIDEAKRLISEGNMNFSEISDSLGFSSIHYFSRLFKSVTGMTPSEYAKKAK